MGYDRKPGLDVERPVRFFAMVAVLIAIEGLVVAYIMGWIG